MSWRVIGYWHEELVKLKTSQGNSCQGCEKLIMAVLSAVFIGQLNAECRHIIASYLGDRCTLCEEGRGIAVKDAMQKWQLWCLSCVSTFLLDDTWSSPVNAPLPWSLGDPSYESSSALILIEPV